MATNGTSTRGRGDDERKMDFRPIENFDASHIEPDAPQGKWKGEIPRGKIKRQATKEDQHPMLIVPIKLVEAYDEKNEKYEGAEISVMIVFFPDEKARASRMSKLRLRALLEAADVDMDLVPKSMTSWDDFDDLINALEGAKFDVWTKHNVRKDTNETVVDVLFSEPGKGLKTSSRDRDEEEEEEPEEKPTRGKKPAARGGRR